MFIFGIIQAGEGFDPLVMILAALLVEAYVGEIRFLYRFVRHPVTIIDDGARFFEEKLNRQMRSQGERGVRGMLAALVIILGCGAAGWAVTWLSLNHPWGWPFEFILVVSLIKGRSLYHPVYEVVSGLKENLDSAREAVEPLVRYDPWQLDSHGVARSAIEWLAGGFVSNLVAPVFWYVLLGFPGLLIYTGVRVMDERVGYKNERYRAYGKIVALLEDIMTLIPARLAGLFLCAAAAFVPMANPWRAFRVMWLDAGKSEVMNSGWTIAAIAGAINLRLVGPRFYSNHLDPTLWIGRGKKEATTQDIGKALYLFAVAALINIMWIASIALVRLG